jgi:hypothetical protein
MNINTHMSLCVWEKKVGKERNGSVYQDRLCIVFMTSLHLINNVFFVVVVVALWNREQRSKER